MHAFASCNAPSPQSLHFQGVLHADAPKTTRNVAPVAGGGPYLCQGHKPEFSRRFARVSELPRVLSVLSEFSESSLGVLSENPVWVQVKGFANYNALPWAPPKERATWGGERGA